MDTLILFFEISDKMPSVWSMYSIAAFLGGIGLLLGLWRWWLSAIWFIFPNLCFSFLFCAIQISEINDLYRHVIDELGESYIWHSYISAGIAILLNIVGILIKDSNERKLTLK
jgi:hypothetical protein